MDDQKIQWLREDVVRAIHRRQLAEHGSPEGVRDEGLLQSALARPCNQAAYADPPADLAQLAAAYAFGIAKNHPFVDGNKRTAYIVCRSFLLLNGHDIQATQAEKYEFTRRLAAGTLSEAEATEQLRAWLIKRG
jgi:death-on-curing protein